MRIISSFRDYYDNAMSYGVDLECIYKRETSEIALKRNEIELPYDHEWKFAGDMGLKAEPAVIGFCGRLYPTVMVSSLYGSTDKLQCFYDASSYIAFITEMKGDLKLGGRYFSWYGRGDLGNEKGVMEFFNRDFKKLEKKFTEHNSPIFIITEIKRELKITLNPKLSSYFFVRVVDPPTAFQEIFMYKAGVLGNKEVNTVQIDDKHMLKQKGFDEYSFKTLKGDKKPRAKNRGKK